MSRDPVRARLEARLSATNGSLEERLSLVDLLRESGDPDAALRHLRIARNLHGPEPRVMERIGLIHLGLGLYRDARRYLEQAKKNGLESQSLLVNLGIAAFGMEEYSVARERFREALETGPEDPTVMLHLGNTLVHLGQFEQARKILSEVLRLTPKSVGAGLALATCLAHERYEKPERTRQAIQVLHDLLRQNQDRPLTDPRWARVYFLLGTLHDDESSGYPAAIAAYQEGLARDPSFTLAHNNLGALFMARGELDPARDHLVHAIALDPEYSSVHHNLARLLFYGLPEDRSVEVFQNIVKAHPDQGGRILFSVAKWLVSLATLEAYDDLFGRAHQVKNILGLVTSQSRRILRDPDLDARVRQRLGGLATETENGYSIMVDLLRFIRPDPIKPVEIDPGDLARKIVARCRQAHGAARIRVRISRDLPRVVADPQRIGEVLENLLINGIESVAVGPRENGTVELRVIHDKRRREVMFSVADEGLGIPEDLALGDLVQAGFTTKESGSGLGLAIVRRLLAEHGGSLEYVRRPRGGICFKARIPIDAQNRTVERALCSRVPKAVDPGTLLADELV